MAAEPPTIIPIARQRRLGALLDHMGVYSRLTVRENLLYFGELRRMPPESLKERVDQVLSVVELESIADRRTSGFSQGERMKTALGRAILHSPQNLLLDEPTNGLDIPTVRSLRNLLRRLRDAGTYSAPLLDVFCQSLIAQGSPSEVCSQTNTASLEEAFVKLTSSPESPIC